MNFSSAHMSPRQRVMTALNHQPPDRVPTALGGGPYGLVDELYLRLVDALSLGSPVPPFRQGHSISYMDDRLLDRLGTDVRYVWPGALPNSPTRPGAEENTFLDSYGQVWKRALPYFYAGTGILSNAVSIDEIESAVHWPDVADPKWTRGVAERARALREGTDTFVAARMVASHGPFQAACDLRGTENFLLDLGERPEFAAALVNRVTDTLDGLLRNYLLAGGQFFDLIELPGDDYAGNTSLVMSPAMFRRFIQPALQRLVNTVRELAPRAKIMLHSDGKIEKLLPNFIEIGIDVVHPLEPLPSMDLDEIKSRYGEQLAFLGGIDITHAMPGTRDDVIAEVKQRIRQLGEGGGYILAPSNHLQADVPPENVITLFETAHRYGHYPLSQAD